MTDIFEQASALELRQREEAQARQAAKQPTRPSLSHCQDCGAPIPAKRRQCVAGCTRCFHCQNLYEKGNAR
ncbi:TraR/DksA family transcriptional regulator [Laribacter hongkongensis]|uniref:TraR/DksA family transcriptional regulator n=1 Tax=Laribacter hongkongensis TaxID=168471 RepID=UPI001EFC6378|nr:TraR/DksA family transcriptional regulator [Laribacter hongkongensis]MCG8993231.1 TraR/DksA family transcriptional regulator [Laribacter hongkongensis]MCG8997950.1 TraR/DksA family transcriptional regulator [Laribacter hongkongensis]MCG9002339.1 TraR/DksA family transcriptional regulator [Laribacter hongkongensis]MCG9005649.1 TraR/DksA family transcriptional regulator [Laribacter hongkongensis]MCG9008786.1 TraR/DksA family transcriptional regulator [Laribacter hongkongensis]